MDAIILAGGKGTRLRPAVADVPKPLARVGERPFLDLLLRQLQRFQSVEKVVLAVGYKSEQIEAEYHNERRFGFPIEFSVEHAPLGTAGAIFLALRNTRSQDVLVLNGDSYVEFDLSALAADHSRHAAAITMVVVEVADAGRFGSVIVDSSSERVLGFAEKTGSSAPGLINAGCYVLARRVFEHIPIEPASFERDVIPRHLASTYAHAVTGKFIDIGTPESYQRAADVLL